MKECFKEYNFQHKSLITIAKVNAIVKKYQSFGLKLTLRQIYYQFIANDLFPDERTWSLTANRKWKRDPNGTKNADPNYDYLGDLVNKARLAGYIDWDAIEDRTRFLRGRTNWASPLSMIRTMTKRYTINMWANQDYRIEVWIEKDALIGVIENVCYQNDIDYFACRGYASQSELYKAGQRMEQFYNNGKQCVVIHLGDHDPSGIDMTRDNEDTLYMFSGACTEVVRIALNYDQVLQYKPPPNPAKLSDSRAKEYIALHGKSSWELDALEPRVLQNLVQDTINMYKDPQKWKESKDKHTAHKQQLKKVISDLETSTD